MSEDADRPPAALTVDTLDGHRNVVLRDLVHAPATLRYEIGEHVAESIVEQPHVEARLPHRGRHVGLERVSGVDEASLRQAVDQKHGLCRWIHLRISCELQTNVVAALA